MGKKKTKAGAMDDNAMARGASRNNYIRQLEEASDNRSQKEKDIDSIFEFDEDSDLEEESYDEG